MNIKDTVKIYYVNSIEKNQLKINGKANHPLWKQTKSITNFKSPWDSETLFFCFKVEDQDLQIDTTDNTNRSINESDRVELFFRADELLNPYYCLEIDAKSRIMDFEAKPDKQFDFNWNWPKEDIEVKSAIESTCFIVEIAISLASLTQLGLLKEGKIETGIYRAKYNKQENGNFEPTWITWVDPETETPNFHIASSFGILKLENFDF